MKNCKWEIGLLLVATSLVVLSGGSQIASAGSVYNAVADFSISANPNGQWSYLYDTGSGPQLFTHALVNDGAPGVDGWWDGLGIPDSVKTDKNTTTHTVTIAGTI